MSGTRLSESLPTLTNVREHCTTVQTWPNTYEAPTCQEPNEVRRKKEGLPLLGFMLSRPRLV
jgi:hypothetical protein